MLYSGVSVKINRRGVWNVNIGNLLPVAKQLYIDPSAVTVAVSSIGGIAIAVGAGVAIWWTRAKKKAAEKLHIDVNARKEVEEDLVINPDETNKE